MNTGDFNISPTAYEPINTTTLSFGSEVIGVPSITLSSPASDVESEAEIEKDPKCLSPSSAKTLPPYNKAQRHGSLKCTLQHLEAQTVADNCVQAAGNPTGSAVYSSVLGVSIDYSTFGLDGDEASALLMSHIHHEAQAKAERQTKVEPRTAPGRCWSKVKGGIKKACSRIEWS